MEHPKAKKSESIEIRLSHDSKQALMRKAALEGRSVSDILRVSITDYLDGAELPRLTGRRWQAAAALTALGAVFLFAYLISSAAWADHSREFEAARARLALPHSDTAERNRLSNRYAKEFASQRILTLSADQIEDVPGIFSLLDVDGDGRLSLAEYRELMNVPEGDPGRKLFQSKDRNRDGWLSKEEFAS